MCSPNCMSVSRNSNGWSALCRPARRCWSSGGRHGYWRRRFRAGDALHDPAPLSRAETAGPGGRCLGCSLWCGAGHGTGPRWCVGGLPVVPGGILVRLGVRQTRIPGRHGRPARELGSLEGPPRCQGIRSRTLTLGTATFATITGESAGYPTGWIVALYGVSILALIAFIFVEHRAENPMLNLSFFRRPPFCRIDAGGNHHLLRHLLRLLLRCSASRGGRVGLSLPVGAGLLASLWWNGACLALHRTLGRGGRHANTDDRRLHHRRSLRDHPGGPNEEVHRIDHVVSRDLVEPPRVLYRLLTGQAPCGRTRGGFDGRRVDYLDTSGGGPEDEGRSLPQMNDGQNHPAGAVQIVE